MNRDIEQAMVRLWQAMGQAWADLGMDFEGLMAAARWVREARGTYGQGSLTVATNARLIREEGREDLGHWRDEVVVVPGGDCG